MSYDLRFALRMILAHRWFSLAVVVTLALGIGLNTMVFTIINAALFKPVPVPGGARLVSIATHMPDGRDARMSYPALLDYRAQAHSFEALEGGANQEGVLGEPGIPPQSYHLQRATAGIFSMLHMHPVLGRDFSPSDANPGAAPVLMIGYAVWQERYAGSLSVIGRAGPHQREARHHHRCHAQRLRLPHHHRPRMPLVPTPNDLKRDNRQVEVFGILPAAASPSRPPKPKSPASPAALPRSTPTPIRTPTANVMTFHERYNGGNIKMVFILMLASVGFVLLIACANVANMMLSRAIGRQREMSIRAALGASRWRVVRQLLIESVALSILGGALGLVLGVLGVRWFNLATANVGKPYWVQFTMDYTVFGYFAALCILSGLAFGIAPAIRASRPDLNRVLQDGARTIGRHRGGFLAAALVVFQFALTVVLLTGAGVFVHSLLKALEINRSVPTSQLMVARLYLPDERYKDTDARQRFYDQLLPRLAAIPGVTHATIVSNPPGLGSADRHIEIEHGPVLDAAHRPPVSFVVSSPGYLDIIHLPLLRGRDFTNLDGTAGHLSAIVTRETAAALLAWTLSPRPPLPPLRRPQQARRLDHRHRRLRQHRSGHQLADPIRSSSSPSARSAGAACPSLSSPPAIPPTPSARPSKASIGIFPSATPGFSPAPSSTSSGISTSSAKSLWDSPSSLC